MPDAPAPNFADLLRHYRHAAGFTQEALAERAGLSVHGIQKLERGVTHPYRDTARRLASALRLGPDDEHHLSAAVRPVRRRASTGSHASTNPTRHNLPTQISSFVGRDQAMAEITAHLERARLLTLTGVAGCGKTRLALEVARAVLERFPDGVWLVELASLADGSLLADRVGAAVGVRGTGNESLHESLVNALSTRHLLLVLDNCEHLLNECAVLVDRVLRSCPGVRALATSREPISIDGETVWRVPSLAIPDSATALTIAELSHNPSIQLFVDRATAVKPSFALTTQNASAITQICQRLDGIPLALELAAARIEALTPEQLCMRLDERFRLLTGGSRAALPRQQTLEAALEWSYDLLTEAERTLLQRLAVFSRGWTLDAAEAVCHDSTLPRELIVDSLVQLVHKSLVVASETGVGMMRYRLLETVRDFARQKMVAQVPADAAALRERHADYYTTVAERLNPPGTVWHLDTPTADVVLEQLGAEFDNLRATLAWRVETRRPAAGLRLLYATRGYFASRGLYHQLSWIRKDRCQILCNSHSMGCSLAMTGNAQPAWRSRAVQQPVRHNDAASRS